MVNGRRSTSPQVERIIPLQKLQGQWISSFRDTRICVDLLCVYIRTQKCKQQLHKRRNRWRWFGWTLTELIEDDEGKSKSLKWENQDTDTTVIWTRYSEQEPALELRRLDMTAPMNPSVNKAMKILNRTFEVSSKIKSNPRSELYGIEFSDSVEGIFACCLIVRDVVNLVIYFATRPPLQGLGFGQILLDRVMSYPTEEVSYGDGEELGANRWVAIIRRKTEKAVCDSTAWWKGRHFLKDSTEELEEYNPFDDCIALEYTGCVPPTKRRRLT